MKNILPWRGRLALIFLLLAAAFNCIHFAVFKDSDYIFKFILAQLGFLPISAYLVTVIINQLLGKREKLVMLKKLNMVIGSFFSQVGTRLLAFVSLAGGTTSPLQPTLLLSSDWQDKEYQAAKRVLESYDFSLDPKYIDWQEVRNFLLKEKSFLLSLLGNPNLLEHETFTELLWAVFHLAEELESRESVADLPEPDLDHLTGDLQRVYALLVGQWLDYMQHLQSAYPFLFSLAVRTNPFDPAARVEVMS